MITILSFPANNRNININDNNTSNSMLLDFSDNVDLFERYDDLFE